MKKVLVASLVVVSLLLLASGAMADYCPPVEPEPEPCPPVVTCPPIVIDFPDICCPDIDLAFPEAPCCPEVIVKDIPEICCPEVNFEFPDFCCPTEPCPPEPIPDDGDDGCHDDKFKDRLDRHNSHKR